MTDVRIIPGTTLEYIDQMSNRMRPVEAADFKRYYDTVWEGIIECCLQSNGELYTALIDGELACIWGVHAQWGGGSAFGTPWLVLTESGTKYPKLLMKHGKEIVERWKRQYAFIHNNVPGNDEPAQRFLKALGFTIAEEPYPDGSRLFSMFGYGVDECVSSQLPQP